MTVLRPLRNRFTTSGYLSLPVSPHSPVRMGRRPLTSSPPPPLDDPQTSPSIQEPGSLALPLYGSRTLAPLDAYTFPWRGECTLCSDSAPITDDLRGRMPLRRGAVGLKGVGGGEEGWPWELRKMNCERRWIICMVLFDGVRRDLLKICGEFLMFVVGFNIPRLCKGLCDTLYVRFRPKVWNHFVK